MEGSKSNGKSNYTFEFSEVKYLYLSPLHDEMYLKLRKLNVPERGGGGVKLRLQFRVQREEISIFRLLQNEISKIWNCFKNALKCDLGKGGGLNEASNFK